MKCKADRVGLIAQNIIINDAGMLGCEWSAAKVKVLEVEPERMIATCTIRGQPMTAAVSWAKWPNEDTARRAGQMSKLTCEVCAQEFENQAGLQSHRSVKHGVKSARVEVLRTEPTKATR